MKQWIRCGVIGLGLMSSMMAMADQVTVSFFRSSDAGKQSEVGAVTFIDTRLGLLIRPQLHGLAPGLHGFHVHQHPDCGDHGLKAGGHFDPAHTGKHLGPYNLDGHLGDLPALYVDARGQATHDVLAPRLHVINLKGRNIIVHAGGDNYSDIPKPLGGGGQRIACGVVKETH